MGIHLGELPECWEEQCTLVDVGEILGREPFVNIHAKGHLAELSGLVRVQIILDSRDGVEVGSFGSHSYRVKIKLCKAKRVENELRCWGKMVVMLGLGLPLI